MAFRPTTPKPPVRPEEARGRRRRPAVLERLGVATPGPPETGTPRGRRAFFVPGAASAEPISDHGSDHGNEPETPTQPPRGVRSGFSPRNSGRFEGDDHPSVPSPATAASTVLTLAAVIERLGVHHAWPVAKIAQVHRQAAGQDATEAALRDQLAALIRQREELHVKARRDLSSAMNECSDPQAIIYALVNTDCNHTRVITSHNDNRAARLHPLVHGTVMETVRLEETAFAGRADLMPGKDVLVSQVDDTSFAHEPRPNQDDRFSDRSTPAGGRALAGKHSGHDQSSNRHAPAFIRRTGPAPRHSSRQESTGFQASLLPGQAERLDQPGQTDKSDQSDPPSAARRRFTT